ncbi:MAG: DUF58 domain-containing protein [Spirochaetaceae bacterium]|nr:MAG: DUF58 domain-containing protein [Spirochaetaceae bacterium]
MRLSVHPVAILSYLLAIVVTYLAASYLGGMFRYLFAVAAVLPVLSLLHMLVLAFSLRVDQLLEGNAPARGDNVAFALWVENASWLPAHQVRARLILSWPGVDQPQADAAFSLRAQREYSYRTAVLCRHRGNYRFGIDWLEVGDMLGICALRRRGRQERFCVYPRVINLRFSGGPSAIGAGIARTATFGREIDPTLLRGLSEYQRDQPVKQIAWRRFAAYGIPYVKEYDSGQRPATVIYVDLRAIHADPELRLEVDDCSVEILVAVVKSLVETEIPVEVHGMGANRYQASVSMRAHFREFYLSTRLIEFGGEHSPRSLMALHSRLRSNRAEAALLITHRLDTAVTALLSGAGTRPVPGIVNMSALSESQKLAARKLALQVRPAGGVVQLVEDGEHIQEGLARC